MVRGIPQEEVKDELIDALRQIQRLEARIVELLDRIIQLEGWKTRALGLEARIAKAIEAWDDCPQATWEPLEAGQRMRDRLRGEVA
jgi:hypothetical protein